jgi:predicted RNase H-like HicB family nuclease
VPGVLVLGDSVDEVLERAQAAIDFHIRPERQSPSTPLTLNVNNANTSGP